MKSDKKIASALGIDYEKDIENLPFKIEETKETVEVMPSRQVADEVNDYHMARGTLHNLLKKGDVALEYMLEVAKGSEHPRAYEVVATLMKTLADTSKDLYEIQEKSRKIRDMDNPDRPKSENSNITVDKGIFIGSSADLLKHIKSEKGDKDE